MHKDSVWKVLVANYSFSCHAVLRSRWQIDNSISLKECFFYIRNVIGVGGSCPIPGKTNIYEFFNYLIAWMYVLYTYVGLVDSVYSIPTVRTETASVATISVAPPQTQAAHHSLEWDGIVRSWRRYLINTLTSDNQLLRKLINNTLKKVRSMILLSE